MWRLMTISQVLSHYLKIKLNNVIYYINVRNDQICHLDTILLQSFLSNVMAYYDQHDKKYGYVLTTTYRW